MKTDCYRQIKNVISETFGPRVDQLKTPPTVTSHLMKKEKGKKAYLSPGKCDKKHLGMSGLCDSDTANNVRICI